MHIRTLITHVDDIIIQGCYIQLLQPPVVENGATLPTICNQQFVLQEIQNDSLLVRMLGATTIAHDAQKSQE
jgi:hypothetical protein